MAQQTIKYTSPHRSIYTENKTLYVSSASGESIALDEITSISYNRFAVTITNSSLSPDTVTIVNIYGSDDKNHYYLYKSNIFPGGIGPGATMHYEFVAMTSFIRVTVQSAGLSNMDVFLIGNVGATSSGGGGGGGGTPGTPGTGTVQCGLIQFVNNDTANVVLSLPYTDTGYSVTLTCGDHVVAYYDASSKTGIGFTVYVSCPFTGEVSYEVAHA